MMSIAAVMGPYSDVTNTGIYRLTIIIVSGNLANVFMYHDSLAAGGGQHLLPLEEHAGCCRKPGIHDELDESLVNLARGDTGLQRTVSVIAEQRALALGGKRGDRDEHPALEVEPWPAPHRAED